MGKVVQQISVPCKASIWNAFLTWMLLETCRDQIGKEAVEQAVQKRSLCLYQHEIRKIVNVKLEPLREGLLV